MLIETERLKIRDVALSDEKSFIEMAQDGSLNDVGFDRNCSSWMKDWIIEAQNLAQKDNPRTDYLAYVIEERRTGSCIGAVGCSFYVDLQKVGITYFVGAKFRGKGYAAEAAKAYVRYYFDHYDENEIIATIREENIASWKVIEKSGFVLTDKRMYKDINDTDEQQYRFYSVERK